MTDSSQACWLTGAGRSAVAVIAARGNEVFLAMQTLFAARTPHGLENAAVLEDTSNGPLLFGHWANGEEVVVCHTNQQWEIHCHGGVAAASQILADLAERGIEIVERSQWTVTRHGTEAAQSAWQSLSKATTLRTAAILLDQARGAWDRRAEEINQWLDDATKESLSMAAQAVDQLRQWVELGSHLDQPWRIVLFGAPNAGKSTLINQIVGYQRSIVYQEAGTTRDLVTATTVIDGWPFEFCDTAGLRKSDNELEMAGVDLTESALATADLAVHVIDLSQPTPRTMPSAVTPKILRVGNKQDLVAETPPGLHVDVSVSAMTGRGMEQLLRRLAATCVPNSPPPGAAVPFTPTCRNRLQQWDAALTALGRKMRGQEDEGEGR